MKNPSPIKEFSLTVSNIGRRGFIYQPETLGITAQAEKQSIQKYAIQKPTFARPSSISCPISQDAVSVHKRNGSHAHWPHTDAAYKINPCRSVRVNGILILRPVILVRPDVVQQNVWILVERSEPSPHRRAAAPIWGGLQNSQLLRGREKSSPRYHHGLIQNLSSKDYRHLAFPADT